VPTSAPGKMSHGAPPVKGPWNQGEGLELVEDPPLSADGGDGTASVELGPDQSAALEAMAQRLTSDPTSDPRTGAELGSAGGAESDELPKG